MFSQGKIRRGYLNPAFSEARIWARWLHNLHLPGSPVLCTRKKTRNGPNMGKMATYSLPSRGPRHPAQGKKSEKWPKFGQDGYITPVLSGSPVPGKGGGESEMAQFLGKMAAYPLPSQGAQCPAQGNKSEIAQIWATWLHNPHLPRGPRCSTWAKNQKWPKSGQHGSITPAFSVLSTGKKQKWPKPGQDDCTNIYIKRLLKNDSSRTAPVVGPQSEDKIRKFLFVLTACNFFFAVNANTKKRTIV